MAITAGFSGYIYEGANDLSAVVKSASFKRGAKQLDITTINDEDETWITGRKNMTASVKCLYDSANTALTDLITAADGGTSVTFKIGPSSSLYWSGTAYVTMNYNNGGDGLHELDFDITFSGTVTKGP